MNYISPNAEIGEEQLAKLTTASLTSSIGQMRKFLQEIHIAFGLQVKRYYSVTNRAELVWPGMDLPCGHCLVQQGSMTDSGLKYTYTLNLPTINKKVSQNGSKSSRVGTSISGVIRTIRKHNEVPTAERLIKDMLPGLNYAFTSIVSAVRSQPTIALSGDLAVACIRSILGVDSKLAYSYTAELQELFSEYQSKMKTFNSATDDLHRYEKGCLAIGIDQSAGYGKPASYIIGRASRVNGVPHLENLQRLDTLEGHPLSDVFMMIRTYMQSQPNHDQYNELYVPRNDKYYPDIDISTGYLQSTLFWVIIPDEAPQ